MTTVILLDPREIRADVEVSCECPFCGRSIEIAPDPDMTCAHFDEFDFKDGIHAVCRFFNGTQIEDD